MIKSTYKCIIWLWAIDWFTNNCYSSSGHVTRHGSPTIIFSIASNKTDFMRASNKSLPIALAFFWHDFAEKLLRASVLAFFSYNISFKIGSVPESSKRQQLYFSCYCNASIRISCNITTFTSWNYFEIIRKSLNSFMLCTWNQNPYLL
jgi:hypothetical protein